MVEPPDRTMFWGENYVRIDLLVQGIWSYLVKPSTDIDRRGLDSVVDNDRERCQEVAGVDFGVEEYFGCQEAFVSDVQVITLWTKSKFQQAPTLYPRVMTTYPSSNAVDAVVLLEVLPRLAIVLPVLLHDILANVRVALLDSLRDLELILRRHIGHLASFSQQRLHKGSDVSPGNRDMLDRRPNNVTFRTRDNVRDTVSGVDDCAGEGAVGRLVGRPGGGKGENCLDGDVETLDVEGFEEDFGCLLSVFGRV